MKTFLRSKPAIAALGAALALITSIARADDQAQTRHHRRPAKAHKAAASVTENRSIVRSNGQIPTRDDRNAQEVQGGQVGGANGTEYRVPTGSHLPRRYDRKGYTTDSQDSSFIYDQNDQRLRSTNNVGDSLRSVPGLSVRGGR